MRGAFEAYVEAWGFACVYATASGRVSATSRKLRPAMRPLAWATDLVTARRVARQMAEDGNQDVVSAAAKLGLRVTPHETVAHRVEAVLARFDEVLKDSEAKRQFNRAYGERRRAGAVTLPYPVAFARYLKVLFARMADRYHGKLEFDRAAFEEALLLTEPPLRQPGGLPGALPPAAPC